MGINLYISKFNMTSLAHENYLSVMNSSNRCVNFLIPFFLLSESWSQSNLFMAILNTIIFLFGIIILIFPPTRWLIVRIFPSGYGPSEDVRKSGFFTYKSVGVAEGGVCLYILFSIISFLLFPKKKFFILFSIFFLFRS